MSSSSSWSGLFFWGATISCKHHRQGAACEAEPQHHAYCCEEERDNNNLFQWTRSHKKNKSLYLEKILCQRWVCVCFGHSLSDPFWHRLHVSGLAGSLKTSLCLPVFCPTLSLQINVFASPCPLAELVLLLWDCVTYVPSLQRCCWHLPRAGKNTDGQMPWEGFQPCQTRPHKGSRLLRL